MRVVIRNIFTFAFFIISFFPLLSSATGTVPCEQIILGDDTLTRAFGSHEFGQNLVKVLDALAARLESEWMHDPSGYSKAFGDEKRRLEVALASLYTERLRPLLSSIESTAAFYNADEEDEIRDLANKEQNRLLQNLKPLKVELLDLLGEYYISGSSVDSVVLEINRPQGKKQDPDWIGFLARMYLKGAPAMGWNGEILAGKEEERGGYRQVILRLQGPKVFQFLSGETGVHRHVFKGNDGKPYTHQAQVVVYEDLCQEGSTAVGIHPGEIKFEYFRSGGAGGQHVNTTESGVRLVHIPTKMTVVIESDRSQHNNRKTALRILTAKIHAKRCEEQRERSLSLRQSAIGNVEGALGLTGANARTYDDLNDPAGVVVSALKYGDLQPLLWPKVMEAIVEAVRKAAAAL